MSNYDPYEQDRENNAVGPDEDGRYDLGDIDQQPDQLEIGLPLGDYPIEHYGDSVEDSVLSLNLEGAPPLKMVTDSAKQYNKDFLFFMDAMKRNGVL